MKGRENLNKRFYPYGLVDDLKDSTHAFLNMP